MAVKAGDIVVVLVLDCGCIETCGIGGTCLRLWR